MVTYTVEADSKGGWVGRRERKVIRRSKYQHRLDMSKAARDEAARTGVACLVRTHQPDGTVHEHTWTPESARENIESIREICRRAMAPATGEEQDR